MKNYTGNELLDWLITIAGNIYLAIAIIKTGQFWGSEKYGSLALFLGTGIIVGCFIWLNEQTISFLTFVGSKLLGA